MESDAAVAAAEATIQKGSKSFAAAAKLFEPRMRADAVQLYAWCRHCDDVIDGQDLGHGGEAASPAVLAERVAVLRAETAKALGGRSLEPVFAAVGDVARRNAIPARLLDDHLDGFAMDAAGQHYGTLADTLRYCYGVAGVVGLMMAHIMGVRDPAVLDRACDLGLAFQLTNIARDLVEDARVGRIYVPEAWLRDGGIPCDALADPQHRPALAGIARRLVETAEPYYRSADRGIGSLSPRAAWAIATASRVYRAIGTEVVRRGAAAWDSRVSTSGAAKLGHVAAGGLQALGRSRRDEPRPADLWTRPR